jgi:hypothetical protein
MVGNNPDENRLPPSIIVSPVPASGTKKVDKLRMLPDGIPKVEAYKIRVFNLNLEWDIRDYHKLVNLTKDQKIVKNFHVVDKYSDRNGDYRVVVEWTEKEDSGISIIPYSED